MQGIEYKLWFYLPGPDLCVAVPAKCGGTSFYRAIFNVPEDVPSEHVRSHAVLTTLELGRGPYSVREVVKYHSRKRKVLAVRDPVERFRSLWRDKCRDAPAGPMSRLSPSGLMSLIRSHPFGDAHWAPQYAWLVPGCEVVLYSELPTLLEYESVHERRTVPAKRDPEMPVDEIEEFYAADRRLLND